MLLAASSLLLQRVQSERGVAALIFFFLFYFVVVSCERGFVVSALFVHLRCFEKGCTKRGFFYSDYIRRQKHTKVNQGEAEMRIFPFFFLCAAAARVLLVTAESL